MYYENNTTFVNKASSSAFSFFSSIYVSATFFAALAMGFSIKTRDNGKHIKIFAALVCMLNL